VPDHDSPLPEWILDVPASADVFDRWGLDTSCGGKSLDFVCRQAGLDPAVVLADLLPLLPPEAEALPRPAQPLGQL